MTKNYMTITFKTPDAVSDAVDNEIDQLRELDKELGREQDEEVYYQLKEDWMKFLERFTEYGEYITIEFDLDNETAKVMER
jgi:hypothetical protein